MRIILFLGIFIIVAVLPGCASSNLTAEKTTSLKSSGQESRLNEKESWEAEWNKIVAEAQKERKVVIYTTAGSEVRAALSKSFKEAYMVELEFVVGRGEALNQKLVTERKVGLYLADIYMAGITTQLNSLKPAGILDKLEPYLILSEVTRLDNWLFGRLPYIDKDHFVMGFRSSPSIPIDINISLVREDEIKSYKNLLEPRWKGKIVMQDPTMAGTTQTLLAMIGMKLMSWDIVKELARQEPVLLRDDRLLVEWVARGKYPIGIGLKSDVKKEFKKAGSPIVGVIPVEGTFITSGSGAFSAINTPAHPNAARLFVNWLLSREGQTVYSQANMTASARLDIPKDHLPSEEHIDLNKKYVNEDEVFYLGKVEFEKIIVENFAPLLSK